MRRRRAFTLFEIILVMVIMLIIAGMVLPSIFEAMSSDARVTSAADQVRARWADCRSQAMEEGRPYRFAVIPNSGKFKLEPYVEDGSFDPSSGPGLVIEGSLPSGVRFGINGSPVDPNVAEATGGDYVPIAIFRPDGTAMEDVDVHFGTSGGMEVTLRLREFSGTATTIKGSEHRK